MRKIDSMLTECFEQGYTVNDLKATVIDTLSPYFENIDVLNKFWTDSELLSAFEYIVRYQYDNIFLMALDEVIYFYRAVYSKHPSEVLDIITCSAYLLLQKENIMWQKRNNEPYFESNEIDEIVIKAMEHIGSTLEVGVKPIAAELWAYEKLLSKGNADLKAIQSLQFGIIVQNLLDAHRFESILKTEPHKLKLSDWRNIAYHHSYQILQSEEIQCTYGKNTNILKISIDELKSYTYQIIRSSNILSIAHMIFVFDHIEAIEKYSEEHGSDYSNLRISKSLQMSSIAVNLLSQGFKLLAINEDSRSSIADIQDLMDTSRMSKAEKMKRWIHSSQFQILIWKVTQKNKIILNYFSSEFINEFSCNITGDICREVFQGTKELSDIASQMEMDIKI